MTEGRRLEELGPGEGWCEPAPDLDFRGMGADAFEPEHAAHIAHLQRALVELLRLASDALAAGRLQAAVDTVETIRDGLSKLPTGLRPLGNDAL